jgi:hypothetical protein
MRKIAGIRIALGKIGSDKGSMVGIDFYIPADCQNAGAHTELVRKILVIDLLPEETRAQNMRSEFCLICPHPLRVEIKFARFPYFRFYLVGIDIDLFGNQICLPYFFEYIGLTGGIRACKEAEFRRLHESTLPELGELSSFWFHRDIPAWLLRFPKWPRVDCPEKLVSGRIYRLGKAQFLERFSLYLPFHKVKPFSVFVKTKIPEGPNGALTLAYRWHAKNILN